jgi:branched-chain amino acid:cation transporter, LIVCS family
VLCALARRLMTTIAPIREKSKRRAGIFFTGMALYCMFFGAGNLIFPLLIGKSAGSQTPAALFGLTISAVAFPLLGLISMMLYGGSLHRFLERLGKGPAFCLLLVLQITQGPLCMSRLFTLMHASIKGYFPWATLPVASILIASLSFILVYRPQRLIALLGVILTPVFLLSLGILVVVGIAAAPPIPQVPEGAAFHFMQGIRGGYLTMDLISALLFATMVVPHFAAKMDGESSTDEGSIRRKMTGASLVAAGLLTISYVGLAWLSAHHSPTLPPVVPEDLLQAISIKILGRSGGIIAAATVFLACLTTAISLAAVFSNYLRQDLFKSRISSTASLALTLGITAAITNLGFSGILRIMGPILEILYPGLIVLCLLNIAFAFYQVKPLKVPVFVAFILSVGGFCFG